MNRPVVTQVLSVETIQSAVIALAEDVNAWLNGEPVVAVGVLKSSFMFYSDITRRLNSPVHCEFVATASSENAETRTGEMNLTVDIQAKVEGRNVLVIDDLIGTGLTLGYFLRLFRGRQARSVKTCALATKQKRSVIPLSVDFVALTLEDRFFVGYGMDYRGWFRELPYIGAVES